MSDNVIRLLDIGTSLNQIDLGVTIRRAFDTFREQVAAAIIEWLLDLTHCKLGTDTLILREIISAELLSPRKKDSSSLSSIQGATKVYNEVDNPARLDWLFLYHTRLWKKPRLNLKQIYVSILNLSHHHKIAVGSYVLSIISTSDTPLIDVKLLTSPASTTALSILICSLTEKPRLLSSIPPFNCSPFQASPPM